MPTSEAQTRATLKYRKSNITRLTLDLTPNDADIIAWLSTQPTKAGAIKALIRKEIRRNAE